MSHIIRHELSSVIVYELLIITIEKYLNEAFVGCLYIEISFLISLSVFELSV
jgi:hypothetical protein